MVGVAKTSNPQCDEASLTVPRRGITISLRIAARASDPSRRPLRGQSHSLIPSHLFLEERRHEFLASRPQTPMPPGVKIDSRGMLQVLSKRLFHLFDEPLVV